MSPNRRQLNPLVLFGAVLLVVILATVLFAFLYSGGGLPLSGTAPTPVPTQTPLPTPTPTPSAARMYAYRSGNKWGYKDEMGKVRIEPKYEKALEFSEGLAFVAVETDGAWKYGAIDQDGKPVFDPIYLDARSYKQGLAPVKIGELWGYIDKTGKEVIPASFSSAGDFCEGLAKVTKNGKFGHIDTTGNVIVPFDYLEAQDFAKVGDRLFAVVGDKDATGIMRYHLTEATTNRDGVMSANIVISLNTAIGTKFSEGFLAVRVGTNKYAYYDTLGKNAFGDKTFEAANSFSGGFAAVKVNGKWGFIDKTGELIFGAKYEEVQDFSDERAAFMESGKWGYLDTSGGPAITNRYDKAYPFENGYALVQMGSNMQSLSKATGQTKDLYVLEEAAAVTPNTTKTGVVKLASGSMNVRSAPDKNATKVMSLANGTQVTVLGTDGDWVKIEANGKSGYCLSQYITVQ